MPTERNPGEPRSIEPTQPPALEDFQAAAQRLPPPRGTPTRYQKLALKHRSPMSELWLVKDRLIDRQVVMKIPEIAVTGEHFFENEALLTARLDHPSIIAVHDVGQLEDGRTFFIMSEVKGKDLSSVIAARIAGDTTWRLPRLLQAFLQICNAVHFAHERRVLHLDLKPANLMFGDLGEVYVLDWGLARRLQTPQRAALVPAESVRSLPGTPGYMSPEQYGIDPAQLSVASDVWSLGAVLFELVTLAPMFPGTRADRRSQTLSGCTDLETLRQRAPTAPPDLLAICSDALKLLPEDRLSSALVMRDRLQDFIDGTERRRRAAPLVQQAAELWKQHTTLKREAVRLSQERSELEKNIPKWAAIHEKRPLLQAQDRLEAANLQIIQVAESAQTACEVALSHDPDSDDAQALLARIHYARFEEAERDGQRREMRHARAQVERYDRRGRFVPLLSQGGALSLQTEPSGAQVFAAQIMQRGLIWESGPERFLGQTPLQREELPPGAWKLCIKRTGREDTLLSLVIRRGQVWEASVPVPLYSAAQIGADYVYVPPGPTLVGNDPGTFAQLPGEERHVEGFFMARYPVTVGQYVAFLNAVHADDPQQAARHVPRRVSTLSARGAPYLPSPGVHERYVVPTVDEEGHHWDARWPVFGIDWHDAMAYAAWATQREARAMRLPTEREWEKSARASDGRFFPWGDRFDAALCKMNDSREGASLPEPIGAFPTDRSLHGVHDLAGGIREWCGDRHYDQQRSLRPVRGGAWLATPRVCRAANRFGFERYATHSYIGFRLASSEPHPNRGD